MLFKNQNQENYNAGKPTRFNLSKFLASIAKKADASLEDANGLDDMFPEDQSSPNKMFSQPQILLPKIEPNKTTEESLRTRTESRGGGSLINGTDGGEGTMLEDLQMDPSLITDDESWKIPTSVRVENSGLKFEICAHDFESIDDLSECSNLARLLVSVRF